MNKFSARYVLLTLVIVTVFRVIFVTPYLYAVEEWLLSLFYSYIHSFLNEEINALISIL